MAVIDDYICNYIDKAIEKKLDEIINCLSKAPDHKKAVYTNKEMMQILDVDAKTLKKYGDEGLLGFSHPHDKYFYTHRDLENFLMNKNIRYEPFITK